MEFSLRTKIRHELEEPNEPHQKAENIINFVDEILTKELVSVSGSLETLELAVENHPSVRTSIYSKKGQKEILENLKIAIKS